MDNQTAEALYGYIIDNDPTLTKPEDGTRTVIINGGATVITSDGRFLFLACTALSIIQGVFIELEKYFTPRYLKNVVGEMIKNDVKPDTNELFSTPNEVVQILQKNWKVFCDKVLFREINVIVSVKYRFNGDAYNTNFIKCGDHCPTINVVITPKAEHYYTWVELEKLPNSMRKIWNEQESDGLEHSEKSLSVDFNSNGSIENFLENFYLEDHIQIRQMINLLQMSGESGMNFTANSVNGIISTDLLVSYTISEYPKIFQEILAIWT